MGRTKKDKKEKIVCVTWEDAGSAINTCLRDVLNGKYLVRTCGFLEYRDKHCLVIKMHDGGIDDCHDMMKIPSGLVRKIEELEKKK